MNYSFITIRGGSFSKSKVSIELRRIISKRFGNKILVQEYGDNYKISLPESIPNYYNMLAIVNIISAHKISIGHGSSDWSYYLEDIICNELALCFKGAMISNECDFTYKYAPKENYYHSFRDYYNYVKRIQWDDLDPEDTKQYKKSVRRGYKWNLKQVPSYMWNKSL